MEAFDDESRVANSGSNAFISLALRADLSVSALGWPAFVRLCGPAVQAEQLAFVEDWYWATDEVPHLSWTPIKGSLTRWRR